MRCLAVMLVLCLSACSIFRKTNKEMTNTVQLSNKHLEANKLILKKAEKETKIFTYWTDSGFHQLQFIKEEVGQTEAGNLKIEKKEEAKHTVNSKKHEPVTSWIYAVILFLILSCYLLCKKMAS